MTEPDLRHLDIPASWRNLLTAIEGTFISDSFIHAIGSRKGLKTTIAQILSHPTLDIVLDHQWNDFKTTLLGGHFFGLKPYITQAHQDTWPTSDLRSRLLLGTGHYVSRLLIDLDTLHERAKGKTLEEASLVSGLTRENTRRRLINLYHDAGLEPKPLSTIRKEAQTRHEIDATREALRYLKQHPGRAVQELSDATGLPPARLRALLPDYHKRFLAPTPIPTENRSTPEGVILDNLRRAHSIVGKKYLKKDDFDRLVNEGVVPAPRSTQISNIFDKWSVALEEAGVPCKKYDRKSARKWDENTVDEYLVDYFLDPSNTPVYAKYAAWAQEQSDAPSARYVRLRLGTWNDIRDHVNELLTRPVYIGRFEAIFDEQTPPRLASFQPRNVNEHPEPETLVDPEPPTPPRPPTIGL